MSDVRALDIPFSGDPERPIPRYPIGLDPMPPPPLPPVPERVLCCWMQAEGLIPSSCYSAGGVLPRDERVCLCWTK